MQPSGLATPEACKDISPGYAFFAYPGKTISRENRTPVGVRGLCSDQGWVVWSFSVRSIA